MGALAFGYDYHEYWHELDPYKCNDFLASKYWWLEKQLEKDNQQAWLQGAYVKSALESVLGSMFSKKNIKYTAPISFNQEYSQEEDENKIRMMFAKGGIHGIKR